MILAIVNQKGGVGKTTTTVNLATALAGRGKNVLVADMDPQGHAGAALGVKLEDNALTIRELLEGTAGVTEEAVGQPAHGIGVWPADASLADIERDYLGKPQGYYLLREALEKHAAGYDVTLIDCPPHLGLLTLNALTAATHYLVPVAPGFLSMDGLRSLEETVSQVRRYTNQALELLGVLLTRADRRTALPRGTEEILREAYGGKLFGASIPEVVALAEAPAFGQPIQVYARRSKGVEAFEALAGEVIQRVGA